MKQRQDVVNRPKAWQDTEPEVLGEFVLPAQSPASQHLAQEFSALSIQFVGPLPPPGIMAEYENVRSDLPDRITAMAEKEQAHRHSKENFSLRASASLSLFGIASGLAIGLFGFYFSIKAVLAGHDVAGTTLGGVTLVAIVSVFVVGRKKTVSSKKAAGVSKSPRDEGEEESVPPHAMPSNSSKVEL